jgi:hypothetical protein
VDDAFSSPLEADLDVLRVLNTTFAFRSRRRHEKLPKKPSFSGSKTRPLVAAEFDAALSQVASWAERGHFERYFCAGEMMAAFCEVLRCVLKRAEVSQSSVLGDVLLSAIQFEEKLVFGLIDDSSGDHVFSSAHIDALYAVCSARREAGHADAVLLASLRAVEEEE